MEQNGNPKEEFQHNLPKNPVEVIQMSKTGTLKLPKEIRDKMPENAKFAYWAEGNRFFFHFVTDEEIPNLNIPEPEEKPKKRRKSTKAGSDAASGAGEGKRKSKRARGPEPELTKYFPFQFENQNAMAQIYETSFYKLAEDPPNMAEALERIRYGIINYSTGNRTNDARLFNSVINFLEDVVKKMPEKNYSEILDFTREKLAFNISSKFLKEKSLISLFSIAVQQKNDSNMGAFLDEILKGVREYKTEAYAIMQGLKNLVKSLRANLIIEDTPEKYRKQMIDEIIHYIRADTVMLKEGENDVEYKYAKLSTDNLIQLVDLVSELRFVEKANELIEEILAELPPEDPYIEAVRDKKRELSHESI